MLEKMTLTHWLLIAVASSVLAGGFIIADAIERTAPRYSLTDISGNPPLRLDLRNGALAQCHQPQREAWRCDAGQ